MALGVALTLGACGSGDSRGGTSQADNAGSASSATPPTSVPTTPLAELVLPESEFPPLSGWTFELEAGPQDINDASPGVDKPECRQFAAGSAAQDHGTDRAVRDLEQKGAQAASKYRAEVKEGVDEDWTRTFDSVLAACSSFTWSLPIGDVVVNLERLTVAGIEGDYNAARLAGTLPLSDTSAVSIVSHLVMGVERGLSFQAAYNITTTAEPDTAADVDTNLARMFNAQRARILEAD